MKRTCVILSIVSIAAILLAGCISPSLGGVVTQTKDFTNFTYVDVENILQVEIVQSAYFNVTIIADKDLLDYIVVTQEGEILRIYLNPHHPFTDFTAQRKILRAKIAMPALYGLNLSGAAKGAITGFKSTHDFTSEISGASSLAMEKIEAGKVEIEVSGASKVTGDLKATDARFGVTGASSITLSGSANALTIVGSGASKLGLVQFTLNNADVNLSGATEATINVKEKLDATLSGASLLYFHGNPATGNINVSGASTLKHR
jgi:hypothetical protein